MNKTKNIIWIGWLLASIFYAYQYIIRVLPNIIFEDLIKQFSIDAAQFGQFSGVYYIGYAFFHLPIGILLDRYGPKKIMSLCIGITVCGLLPIIYANNWLLAVMGRLLIGVGSSAAILGTFKIIRMTFEEKYFTRMLSFAVTIGLLGAIYGGGPISYFVQIFGYKAVVYCLAIMGLLLAVITYFSLPTEEQKKKEQGVLENVIAVLKNRKVMVICLLAGLMVGPLEGFADVWGAEFFKKVYSLDIGLSSYLVSTIFVGMCFGAPVLSFVAEKTGSYFESIIGSALFMALAFIFILLFRPHYSFIVFSFIIVGICCAYQILAIYKASTYVDEDKIGLTTALANMIIMFFGYVFHSCIGVVIDIFGGIQSSVAFLYGVSIIPITLLISVFGFIILVYCEKNQLNK